jgi:hypothetical protein
MEDMDVVTYFLQPHMFDVYSTNKKDHKCLRPSLISVQTLSILSNLSFFHLILSFHRIDRAVTLVATIVGPMDPPPAWGAGGGAVVGRGAARIHRRRGAQEEELPSTGADMMMTFHHSKWKRNHQNRSKRHRKPSQGGSYEANLGVRTWSSHWSRAASDV